MVIIEKKVQTLITAEIGFTEFWEAFQNLVADARSHKDTILFLHLRSETKTLVESGAEITLQLAESAYKNVLNVYAADVIDYIAQENGYHVSHYGLYYRHEGIYRCTFRVDGAHI